MPSPHPVEDPRDRAALADYLWRIRGIAPLSWDEEQAAVAEPRPIGRVRLIAANLGQVADLARRYSGRGVPLAELVQAGNTGLLKAADEFDASMGIRFSTYAAWWIKHSIRSVLPSLPARTTGREPPVTPREAAVPLREMAAVAAMLDTALPKPPRARPVPSTQPGRGAERTQDLLTLSQGRTPGRIAGWSPLA